MNIAVLITCHNRREKTLACLRSLLSQREVEKVGGGGQLKIHLFVVDDGSTDGTGEAVLEWAKEVEKRGGISPEGAARAAKQAIAVCGQWRCHLIAGTGELFWARGMALAWREALSTHSANNQQLTTNNFFTHFLWLNDDVVLAPNALATLLNDLETVGARSVIVGACHNKEGAVSYGATDAEDRLISPTGRPQAADGWLTGNVVLVPHEVCERVGIIDEAFTHARADYDYAERLRRSGIPFYASSKFVGECTNNWSEKMSGASLGSRIAGLWRPGYYNLHDLWLIRSRYHGVLRALVSCAHMIFIALRRVK